MLLPFGTSMNNSNVMAIPEDEYYTDQYINYAMDMVNDYEDGSSYSNYGGYDSEDKSYVNDHKHKSKDKDSSSSISLNKLNCINNNVNINGNNTGDINVGNSGRSASTSPGTDEGYLGVGSLGGNYGEGYNKQKDQGFNCIINNNNTNTNIVLGGGGNVTDGNGNVPEPQTCEECFRAFLTEEEIDAFLGSETLEGYCDAVESGNINEAQIMVDLAGDASMDDINAIIECLENLGILT
jgi:hypothetical protein